jgi:hypothetical protein
LIHEPWLNPIEQQFYNCNRDYPEPIVNIEEKKIRQRYCMEFRKKDEKKEEGKRTKNMFLTLNRRAKKTKS